jgi:hypothetical protein
MCGCNRLNGYEPFDEQLVQQVAERYNYMSNYGDRMRSIDEDYGQYGPEFLAAVDKIYKASNKVAIRNATSNNSVSTSQYVAPPNGKPILSPDQLKKLFLDLNKNINFSGDRAYVVSYLKMQDIDVERTIAVLNSIPVLLFDSQIPKEPSGQQIKEKEDLGSIGGMLFKTLAAIGIGYGLKKIFFSKKEKSASPAVNGVPNKAPTKKVQKVNF